MNRARQQADNSNRNAIISPLPYGRGSAGKYFTIHT
jgi:hypothetical protein